MKELGPDDYDVGRKVSVVAGPFRTKASPFPPGMFGQDPAKEEETHLHGRVFRILVFDPPWIHLKPLDGIGEPLQVQHAGPFTMVPYGGAFTPDAVKLDVRLGVKLAEVSDDYARSFTQHFCPPEHLRRQQAAKPAQPSAATGPITRMLEEEHNCEQCEQRGRCPHEKEVRRS